MSGHKAALAPLAAFVGAIGDLLDHTREEAIILRRGETLLADLIATDSWLPETHARPNPERYTQYLLYRDPADRFSVVSFVWGPGQSTPVHDHTVWGLVGVLRGAELSERYEIIEGLRLLGSDRLDQGTVDAVSPRTGDIHRVSNAFDDRVSISIHVYGADIGKVERATYAPDGRPKAFISGYADAPGLDLLEESA